MNNQLYFKMVEFYNKHSFTHDYIFGVNFEGNIYMIKTKNNILPYVLTLDKASRNNGYSLRFKPNNKIKTLLISQGAKLICSTEKFNNIVSNSKYNKGEIFEKLVTEHFGQVWEKDNIPFTDDGDLTVNKIAYQIKFESATFINEKQMIKMDIEKK